MAAAAAHAALAPGGAPASTVGVAAAVHEEHCSEAAEGKQQEDEVPRVHCVSPRVVFALSLPRSCEHDVKAIRRFDEGGA
jgi:hypothetical protein